MSLLSISVIIFSGITVGIGFWSFFQLRGKAVNYYKAGAAMPIWVVGITLCAQAFDANATLGAASLSREFGFWAGASIPIGLAACLLITGLIFAKPIHHMNLMTLPDFYRRRYSQSTETVASLSMLASNIILIAGNLAGLGILFERIFGVGYVPMLIIVATFIIAYAITGGLLASISTSVFQVGVFIIGMLLSFFWLTSHYGWTELMLDVPTTHKFVAGLTSAEDGALVNWAGLISLGLGDVVAIDFMQRVISSDSPKTAQRGCYMGALLTVLVGVPAALIGLYAFHMFPMGEAGNPNLLVDIATDSLPQLIGILLILGIIAASMSTASGVILALANVITRNLVQRHMKTRWSDEVMLRFSRMIAIPTMAAAVLFAYMYPSPGTLLILAFDVVLAGCFVPLFLGIFWKKSNTPAAIASIVVGAGLRLLFGYLMTIPDLIPVSWAGLDTLIPPVVTLVLFVTVALATQKISKPKSDAFDYVPTDEELVKGIY